MRSTMVWLLVVACAGAPAFVARPSAAAPKLSRAERRKAHSLADQGLELFRKESYEQAIDKFQQAEDIVHAPPHLLFIARAQAKLGRLLAARDTYQRVIDEDLGRRAPKAFVKAQRSAKKELPELDAEIPRVALTVEGPPVEATRVFVDEREVTSLEMPLDPGSYRIRAEANGYEPAESSVTLERGGGVTSLSLSLVAVPEPLPPAAEEPETPVAPVVIMAGGAALLVVGGVTGGLALNKADELKHACPSNPCPTQYEGLKDDATTFATVSTVTLTAGGVVLAAGAGWLIYDMLGDSDDEAGQAGLQLRIGPTSVGLTGAF